MGVVTFSGEAQSAYPAAEAVPEMRNVGKFVWTLLLIQSAAIALLFGGYWGLRASSREHRNQMRVLERRLAAAEHSVMDRAPAATGQPAQAPSVAEPIQRQTELVAKLEPALSGAGADSTRTGKQAESVEKVGPASGTAAAPPAAKTVAEAVAETVVCVDKNTHAVLPCDQAARCLGSKSYEAGYFNALRTKLGIAGAMMICSARTAEAASEPAAPEQSWSGNGGPSH